ncbi:hypothetical protein ACFOG5_15795 [Pedobacter fastidiosus]
MLFFEKLRRSSFGTIVLVFMNNQLRLFLQIRTSYLGFAFFPLQFGLGW